MGTGNKLKAIIGANRSGTTWLGTLVDSHPEVIYRFEPFHRSLRTNAELRSYIKMFDSPDLSDEMLERTYRLLLEAHPLTSKPPFFKKNYRGDIGILWMWMVAKGFDPARSLYKRLYTPGETYPLVFKEVSYERRMKNILSNTSIPITYLIRHPAGTVLSETKGQMTGKMPTGRHKILKNQLKKYNPVLYERYESEIDSMSLLEKNALNWRVDLEIGVSAIRETGKGLLLTYEQLCEDAYTQVNRVFDNFGLQMEKETELFIDKLYSIEDSNKKLSRKINWGDDFFKVNRNPKKQKSAWKSSITADERKKIEKLVQDSEAFQYCAALGGWD